MGHSSKKHSHHRSGSHHGRHREHGDGGHDFHGGRASCRPGGFGAEAGSGDRGGFEAHARTAHWAQAQTHAQAQTFVSGAFGHPGPGGGVEGHRPQVSTSDKVARLVLAAFALFEAARAFYEESPRARSQPARPKPAGLQPLRPQPAQRAPASPPARISVCTGRSCSRRWDSLTPADDVRRAAAAAGQAASVSASPCMKMCEQGPIVAAASSTAGERVFVNVQRRELTNIINAVSGRR